MEGNIFEKSIELMVVGMGTTFLFLFVLVLLMGVLQKFVEWMDKVFPPKQAAAPAAAAIPSNAVAIAIAIAAARRLK